MTDNTHQTCPFCEHNECFSYDDESGVFNCLSCGAKPSTKRGLCYDGETLTPFGFKEDVMEEDTVPSEVFMMDEYRGISKRVMEMCDVYFTKYNGMDTVHYTYPNATKHRTLPKQIAVSGKLDAFWGQDRYPAGDTITITEGEEDRMSVIEIMGDYPTVSVPGASPSKDFWENAKAYLSNWKKIVLSVDNDGAGTELADKFYRLFPGKVYRVNHGQFQGQFKDANDFLQKGARAQYKAAWWNAQKVKPENLLCTTEDYLKLYNDTPNYEYFETGIEELDAKMLGIHKGAFTVVLAPTGVGKTEFFRYLEHRILSTTDYTFAACHGEETQLRSLLGLVSYDLQLNVTRKDLIDNLGVEEEVKASIERISKDERVYQFKIRSDDNVDDIVDQVRFLAEGMGVDFVFIEPIQDFVSGFTTSEKESRLTDLVNKLKMLAPELNVGVVVVAHSNKDGEAKYAASIVQGAAFEIRLDRDPDAEDAHERKRTDIYVGRKNRTGGGSGPAGSLTWDGDAYMLRPDDSPVFDATTTQKDVF